jgi:hypothetical protein
MLGGKKSIGLLICLLLVFMSASAIAADRPIDKQDLKGITAKRHNWAFATAGGAAIGAGIGALVGGHTEVFKGILMGGGGGSAAWLHSHRSSMGGWRPLLLLGSHTALGTGIGWTICGCNDGAFAGAMIGGGASAIWQSMKTDSPRRTASTASAP